MFEEYIERNALLEKINENPAEQHGERCAQILEAILEAPEVDVEHVVRCMFCKYAYINRFTAMENACLCRRWTTIAEGVQIKMPQDGYCSYGERKE